MRVDADNYVALQAAFCYNKRQQSTRLRPSFQAELRDMETKFEQNRQQARSDLEQQEQKQEKATVLDGKFVQISDVMLHNLRPQTDPPKIFAGNTAEALRKGQQGIGVTGWNWWIYWYLLVAYGDWCPIGTACAQIQTLKDLTAFTQKRFDAMPETSCLLRCEETQKRSGNRNRLRLDQEGMEQLLEISEIKKKNQEDQLGNSVTGKMSATIFNAAGGTIAQDLEQQHLVEYKLKKDQDMLVPGAQKLNIRIRHVG